MRDAAEMWRPVLGYEAAYEVSDQGRVRSLSREVPRSTGCVERKQGRILRQCFAGKGYLYVTLSVGGVRLQVGVHRLVAGAFLGPSHGRQVNHLDLNKANNLLGNLEWATRKENAEHARDAGRYSVQHASGKTLAWNNPRRAKKLNREQVTEIRKLAASREMSQSRIAAKFGVTQAVISKIHIGECWRDSFQPADAKAARPAAA